MIRKWFLSLFPCTQYCCIISNFVLIVIASTYSACARLWVCVCVLACHGRRGDTHVYGNRRKGGIMFSVLFLRFLKIKWIKRNQKRNLGGRSYPTVHGNVRRVRQLLQVLGNYMKLPVSVNRVLWLEWRSKTITYKPRNLGFLTLTWRHCRWICTRRSEFSFTIMNIWMIVHYQ